MELIIALVGLGLAVYYQQAKTFIANYTISLVEATFNQRKTEAALFTQLYFNVNLNVNNPTDFAGVLNNMSLAVTFTDTGQNIGNVILPKPVAIRANGDTPVQLPVAINALNIFSDITTFTNAINSGQPLMFHVKGNLIFGIGTLSIDEDYPLNLG